QRPGRQQAPAAVADAAVEQRDPVGVAGALRGGDLLAVERHRRAGVVAAVEADPAGAAAAGGDLVDLRAAAAVGGEVQAGAVRAPGRLGVDAEVVGDLGQVAGAEVHHVDVRVAALGQGQRQPGTVRREAGRAVDAAEAGDLLARGAGDVLHVDRRVAAVEVHVGQLAPVRAPRRRHQRLRGIDHRARVVAIGIGHHQRVTRAAAQAGGADVGDPGPARAGYAEDLLVHRVADLVGDVAHRSGRRLHREAEQALLLGHVEQFVLDPVAAAAGHAAADQHVVLPGHAPGRVGDFAAAGRALRHPRLVQRTELAGTGQVGADHVVDVGFAHVAGERHHRDRQGRGVAADDVDVQPL